QLNKQRNIISGQNALGGNELLGQTESNYYAVNSGYNLSGDLLYQHKFNKPKRTLSVGITPTVNNKKGNTELYSINQYFTDSTVLDQNANTSSENYTLSGNISYTEPAGKQGILQFSYNPSYTWNKSDKETFNYDS